MLEDNPTGDAAIPTADDAQPEGNAPQAPQRAPELASIWEDLVRFGLGETALRVGTGVVSIALFLVVIWVMSNFYIQVAQPNTSGQAAIAAALPASTPTIAPPAFTAADPAGGITRQAALHTSLPNRPRFEVIQYTVQNGDALMAIAAKFNLRPETLLWGNYDVLRDDPHQLRPGQVLNILPVDGVYYKWNAGDGLHGVASFFGVNPEDIVDWPGNHLDKQTLGDYASPNIAPGTWLVIPGGKREFVTWSAPRITRDNPGVAKILGPGFCGMVTDGAVGSGKFIWPGGPHYLSGFDFTPEANHWGIDIAGQEGDPVYAADNGVIVYAGANDWGYGNVVVIDHGNGWQTLYAHLSQINVACGGSVFQGDVIGRVGATGNASGPHLHFEMLSDQLGRVNPWGFLP